MKRHSLIICFLLFVVLATSNSLSAQDTTMSEEEYDKVAAIFRSFLSKEPYRVRYTHETFPSEEAKEPEKINKWMTEYIKPDREHNFYGLNASEPSAKYERIVIAERIFTNKDGKWKELSPSKGGFGGGSGAASAEYFNRGTEKIDGRVTNVYESIITERFARGSGPWQLSYYRSKIWVSKDGRIRKYVGESDAKITKRNRTTEIYEYDSKIKIEAPIK
ncbi:MAG TPA: hypothetical protein PKA82_03620 [Pyrinomonadaceae bacterium]|nr:hypothetical protein [Pyrinomonadaceae bacterium]